MSTLPTVRWCAWCSRCLNTCLTCFGISNIYSKTICINSNVGVTFSRINRAWMRRSGCWISAIRFASLSTLSIMLPPTCALPSYYLFAVVGCDGLAVVSKRAQPMLSKIGGVQPCSSSVCRKLRCNSSQCHVEQALSRVVNRNPCSDQCLLDWCCQIEKSRLVARHAVQIDSLVVVVPTIWNGGPADWAWFRGGIVWRRRCKKARTHARTHTHAHAHTYTHRHRHTHTQTHTKIYTYILY